MDTDSDQNQSPHDQEISPSQIWSNLFIQTILASFFYVLMEWLFFVTKVSSLSRLTFWNSMLVLLSSAGVLILLTSTVTALLMGIGYLTQRLRGQKVTQALAQIIPAATLSLTVMMLADNFTYTLFNYGIVSSRGLWRLLYAAGFILLLGYSWWRGWKAAHTLRKPGARLRRGAAWLAIALAAASGAALIYGVVSQRDYYSRLLETYSMPAARQPNILLIGGDGLSADHLSVYGYERDTTPFLRQLAEESLLAKGHFTNASSTTASTTAILTGREPIEVDVMRYPDILKGIDAYNHLPGILKNYGYTTIQVGVNSYVDAHAVNLLSGFDSINGEQLIASPLLNTLQRLLGDSHVPNFLWTISQRASDRIKHIFFIQQMENPIEAVLDPKARGSDQDRVDMILSMLDQSTRPVFMIAHFMGTHGPEFSFEDQVYSEGDMEDNPWELDFYDDAIASFDSHVERIYKSLQELGMLEDTILVIYSDHGYRYRTHVRLPLIIHFPGAEFAGEFSHNSANFDIPATLLDYMGLPRPDWMDGSSLISDEIPDDRPIYSIIAGSPKKVAAPFFQIKTVQAVVCQQWYQFNVQEHRSRSGAFDDSSSICEADQFPTDEELHEMIIQYLDQHGYEVDSLVP